MRFSALYTLSSVFLRLLVMGVVWYGVTLIGSLFLTPLRGASVQNYLVIFATWMAGPFLGSLFANQLSNKVVPKADPIAAYAWFLLLTVGSMLLMMIGVAAFAFVLPGVLTTTPTEAIWIGVQTTAGYLGFYMSRPRLHEGIR